MTLNAKQIDELASHLVSARRILDDLTAEVSELRIAVRDAGTRRRPLVVVSGTPNQEHRR